MRWTFFGVLLVCFCGISCAHKFRYSYNPLQMQLDEPVNFAQIYMTGVYQSPCNVLVLLPNEMFKTSSASYCPCTNPMHEGKLHHDEKTSKFKFVHESDTLLILVGKNKKAYPFILRNYLYYGNQLSGSGFNNCVQLYFSDQKTKLVNGYTLYSSYNGPSGAKPPLLWDGETLYGEFICHPDNDYECDCDVNPHRKKLWSIADGNLAARPFQRSLLLKDTLREDIVEPFEADRVLNAKSFAVEKWDSNYLNKPIATLDEVKPNTSFLLYEEQPYVWREGSGRKLLRADGTTAFFVIEKSGRLFLYDSHWRPLRKFALYCEFNTFHWDGHRLSTKVNFWHGKPYDSENWRNYILELTFQEKDGELIQTTHVEEIPNGDDSAR